MQAGEVTFAGVTCPVFQCDECLDSLDVGGGEKLEAAFTFAVDAAGRVFDPSGDLSGPGQ